MLQVEPESCQHPPEVWVTTDRIYLAVAAKFLLRTMDHLNFGCLITFSCSSDLRSCDLVGIER